MFQEICIIELADDMSFSFRNIGENYEGDEYTGYRVSLSANYSNNFMALKVA